MSTNDLAKSPYVELPRQTDLVSKSRLDNVDTMSSATVGDEPKYHSNNNLFQENRNGDAQSRVSLMSRVKKVDFNSQNS